MLLNRKFIQWVHWFYWNVQLKSFLFCASNRFDNLINFAAFLTIIRSNMLRTSSVFFPVPSTFYSNCWFFAIAASFHRLESHFNKIHILLMLSSADTHWNYFSRPKYVIKAMPLRTVRNIFEVFKQYAYKNRNEPFCKLLCIVCARYIDIVNLVFFFLNSISFYFT